jgi:hypothetical protein
MMRSLPTSRPESSCGDERHNERRNHALSESLPIGPTYFQRVNGAVAELEKRGALRGS